MASHASDLVSFSPRMTRRTLLRAIGLGSVVAASHVWPVPVVSGNEMTSPIAPLPAPGAGVSAPDIEIADNRRVPNDVCVPVGATVTWVNRGTAWVAIASLDGRFESGRIAPGASYGHTFLHAGSIAYICENHPIRDMTGRITIR